MSAPRRPLHVDADLRIRVDGAPHEVRVTGHGARVQVDVPDRATALRLARDARALGGPREALAALTGGLSEADVDVDVHVAGRRVARLGPRARPGAATRALGRTLGLGGEVELSLVPRRLALGVAAALAAALALGLLWRRRARPDA
ncbi:MAG: hypothetical protein ACK41D_06145 [Rubricoccaceae bacterium]